MKNISQYLAAAALLLVCSCSQTQEGALYRPNQDDARQIHFIQSSVEKEFPKTEANGMIELEIARTGNQGSYTLQLLNKGDNAALFAVPPQATILDGQYSVKVPVKVDLSSFKMGANYKTTVSILSSDADPGDQGAEISQFKNKVNLSATYELEWDPLFRTTPTGEQVRQLATFSYTQYYTGKDKDLEVDKAIGANIYRIHNWGSGVSFKFIVNPDNTCTVPAQSIGYLNTLYNEYVYVADMATYTGNSAASSTYPCTFDGKHSYSFYLIYYVSGGYFSQGVETLEFDAVTDTTPSVDISYLGIGTSPTGIKGAKLAFSPNEFTKSYKATVVSGNIAASEPLKRELRRQLIEGTLQNDIPTITLFGNDESSWNIPNGNYTAVALPYDEQGNPGKLQALRFTNDSEDIYSVKVDVFDFFSSNTNALYSPYTTLFWDMKVRNVKTMKYLCMQTSVLEYLMEKDQSFKGKTLEEITQLSGNIMPEDVVKQILSPEGRHGLFSEMLEGIEYTLGIIMTNEFGDTKFVSKNAQTFGRTANDFDQSKTLDDFVGAFLSSATARVGSNKSVITYRTDIIRINDTEVLITGLSDARDYAPAVRATYDKAKHMLVVEPQYTGPYRENYTYLAFYDGLTYYWGTGGMVIGYIGDKLYWTTNPYFEDKVFAYFFPLFSQPISSGAYFLSSYVGSKIYTFVNMTPLILAPTVTAVSQQPSSVSSIQLKASDHLVESHLMSTRTIQAIKAPMATRSAEGVKTMTDGKVIRTDLTLHTK